MATKIDEVSIFGEYGQPENRLTVALLQILKVGGEPLIRHFAASCGFGLPSSDIEISTQSREVGSTPDGLLRSDFSFSIYIESKLRENSVNEKQLLAHSKLIRPHSTVLYITPDSAKPEVLSAGAVSWSSWKKTRDALRAYIETTEGQGNVLLGFLVEQFDVFASSLGILGTVWEPDPTSVMVVAASKSLRSQLQHRLYICQNARSFRPSAFIALYANGQIDYVLPILGAPEDNVILGERPEFREVVATGEHPDPESQPRRVFRLGEPEKVGPIRNDLRDKNGTPSAYTQGHRYTTIHRIRAAKVTSEL